MPKLTTAALQAATNGFRSLYIDTFNATPSRWQDFAMMVRSSSAQELYGFLNGIPGMRELIGEADIANLASTSFAISNKEWHNTVAVQRAELERDNLGMYAPAFTEMGASARNYQYNLLAKLLNNSFVDVDYTGTPYFALNKPYDPNDKTKGSTKFSNKGTAALSAAAIDEARASLRKRKDAKGENLDLGAKWLLIVPAALEGTANLLAKADRIDGTTNTLQGVFDVIVINQLESDTAWFFMEAGRAIKPFIVQEEIAPEFIVADDPKSEHVLLQKKFIYQSYARGNAGYGVSLLAYGSTGEA